jgi:hypothetical protein
MWVPATVFLTLLFLAPAGKVLGQGGDTLFDFSADVRVFTSYAMMNAAGGGGEWRHAGMNPIRAELREDLAGRIDSSIQQKIRGFDESHGGILEAYEAALLTAGPPDFHWSFDPKTSGDLRDAVESDSGFPELLAEFYQKAGIADLWAEYRPLIQAKNDRYKRFAEKAMQDVEAYCHLDSNYFSSSSRHIHFQFMPLLPYFASLTARVNGDVYVIVGPQEDKPDRSIFYYHLLTRIALPLVRSDSSDMARTAGLYDAVKSKVDLKHGNWNTLVAECFAEAMDIRLEKKLYDLDSTTVDSSLQTEYKYGFMLCRTIYKSLEKYEGSEMAFSDYFPLIMKSIDPQQENERWNDFWSKK